MVQSATVAIPPRDPARVTRVQRAVMLPIMLGMGGAYLLGHYIGGDQGAITMTVVYAIPATIGAVVFIKSSRFVDDYVRGIGKSGDGAGVAIAAVEVVTTVIVDS